MPVANMEVVIFPVNEQGPAEPNSRYAYEGMVGYNAAMQRRLHRNCAANVPEPEVMDRLPVQYEVRASRGHGG